jgi:hypothetical protein
MAATLKSQRLAPGAGAVEPGAPPGCERERLERDGCIFDSAWSQGCSENSSHSITDGPSVAENASGGKKIEQTVGAKCLQDQEEQFKLGLAAGARTAWMSKD